MNMIKNKIAALTLASTMLASCGSSREENEYKYENNIETRQEELKEQNLVDIYDIDDIYVTEINDFTVENRNLYLTYKHISTPSFSETCEEYWLIDKDVIIASNKNGEETTSRFGEYVRSTNIAKFLLYYNIEIRGLYFENQILQIFENIKKDYDKFSFENVNEKKLIK